MIGKSEIFSQHWELDGFYIELTFDPELDKYLSDLTLLLCEKDKSLKIAVETKLNKSILLNANKIKAFFYTPCPLNGKFHGDKNRPLFNEVWKGDCLPGTEKVYSNKLPAKKVRVNAKSDFVHHFEIPLPVIYQQLCEENTHKNSFIFKRQKELLMKQLSTNRPSIRFQQLNL